MPIKGQFSAVIQLNSTNGANGFELDGVAANDYSGFSVATAGDVNGDGIQDIIIGARDASPGGLTNAGKTLYVNLGVEWLYDFLFPFEFRGIKKGEVDRYNLGTQSPSHSVGRLTFLKELEQLPGAL